MNVEITGAESDVQATEVAEALEEAGYFVDRVTVNGEQDAWCRASYPPGMTAEMVRVTDDSEQPPYRTSAWQPRTDGS